jgi:plastocyanin
MRSARTYLEVSDVGRRNWRVAFRAIALCGIAVLVAVSLTGCGGAKPGTVTIHDLKFDPSSVTVSKGSSVTWVNEDQIPVQIQSDDFGTAGAAPGQFSSEPLNPGESFTQKFDTAGKYTYSDPFHPYMTGAVEVR